MNQEASTIARAFYSGWISRFGTPLRVTTDQGRQFESRLFKELNSLTGTTHLRTTAYHPAANGMVERLHRQLKTAIKCHENSRWTDVLPTVLLGIRSAWKEDLQATAAELVYGEPLRLPGEFLVSRASSEVEMDSSTYVKELRHQFQHLRPVISSYHGNRKTFVFKNLATTDKVFVRHDGPKGSLQQPYNGPFKVVHRNSKTFVINIRGTNVTVSIDRLKPAFVEIEDIKLDHSRPCREEIETTPATSVENPMLDSELPFTHTTTICADKHVRFKDTVS